MRTDFSHRTLVRFVLASSYEAEPDKLEAKLEVPALSGKIQSSRPDAKTEELLSKKAIDRSTTKLKKW